MFPGSDEATILIDHEIFGIPEKLGPNPDLDFRRLRNQTFFTLPAKEAEIYQRQVRVIAIYSLLSPQKQQYRSVIEVILNL